MDRDVRAVRWLVERVDERGEMDNFVQTIPGSFEQDWGRNVWREVVGDPSTSYSNIQVQPHPGLPPSARERSTVYKLCRYVRNSFYAYNNEGGFMDTKERQSRMRGCIEVTASLACCTGMSLDSFGEVAELLSEVGDKDRPITLCQSDRTNCSPYAGHASRSWPSGRWLTTTSYGYRN